MHLFKNSVHLGICLRNERLTTAWRESTKAKGKKYLIFYLDARKV